MTSALVPQPSAEQIAAKETERKLAMLAWADKIAGKVIAAATEDAALRFLDRDLDDDERRSMDLGGEYDPIVVEQTGQRLSEAIDEAAATFRQKPTVMRRVYLSALRKKWKQERRRITDPTGQRFGPYMVSRHGAWAKLYAAGGGEGHSGPYVWRRIARTSIEPVALSRDTGPQRNWRHRYLITDETGQFPVEIANEHLTKKAERAIVILIRHGVRVVESDEARQHLAIFLRYRPSARIIRAPAVGWFKLRTHKWLFVLPTETLGDAGNVVVGLDHHNTGDGYGLQRSSTSEQWRRHVAAPLARNSNIILAVGMFLAGPLLRWADEPGGGFHFYGPSKIAKTLSSAVGQSVWGKPYKPGAGADAFGYTWESTPNRLGQRAALRSDIGLSLDEIGVGNKPAIAVAIYKLAGGLDKGRYGQAERDFNVLTLSTGEPSLAEFLPQAKTGQLVRMVDVPALVQPGSALETVPQGEIDAAGARYYAATHQYHGAVGYDWLLHLVDLGPPKIKVELKRHRETWLALPEVVQIRSRAHPQVVSVINRFALLASALAMAIEAGILPWSVADTDAGIIACMERWVRQRGNTDVAGELLQEIRRRRQVFAATFGDRLIRLNKDERGRFVPASEADRSKMASGVEFAGYMKEGRILLTSAAWNELWAGLDAEDVKMHLVRAQLLIPGADGRTTSVEKVCGKADRFYIVGSDFVSDASR